MRSVRAIAALTALAILLPAAAHAAPAPIAWRKASAEITRTYIDWSDPAGMIRYETVCTGELAVPEYDFRERPWQRPEAEGLRFPCQTSYRDTPVSVVLEGRLEWVRAEEFDLGLPPGTNVLRAFFLLSPDVGSEFPYLDKIQMPTGWQAFAAEDFGRTIFRLSPEVLVEIRCYAGHCEAAGPESVYRARVDLK